MKVSAISSFRDYYTVTKPGIIRGNLLNTAAGFLLASVVEIDYRLLIQLLIGTALIIASACIFNNYIDREIDAKMTRTKDRASVRLVISVKTAMIYASILGIAGFTILAIFTNWLTFWIGAIAYAIYIALYAIAKRKSIHGTIIGSFAGALPPVAGYTAVSGQIEIAAMLLFAVLVTWQMPHFYAIAIFRGQDYKAAKLPVLPLIKGTKAAQYQIIGYVLGFIVASSLIYLFNYTGAIYLIMVLGIGLYWLYLGLRGINTNDRVTWARKMFFVSLLVILIFDIAISLTPFID